MKDELVERLQAKECCFWHNGEEPASPDSIFGEAADRILSLQSQLSAAQEKLARAEGALERMADTGDHGEAALNGKSCRALARTALEALREPAAEEGRG